MALLLLCPAAAGCAAPAAAGAAPESEATARKTAAAIALGGNEIRRAVRLETGRFTAFPQLGNSKKIVTSVT
jgi:hypothetical protein